MKRSSLILLIAITLNCQAQPFDNLYVSAGAGTVIPMQKSAFHTQSDNVFYAPTQGGVGLFNLPNVHWRNKYKTGAEVNLALGFQMIPYVRLETEFLYQNMKRQIKGSYSWRQINQGSGDLFAPQLSNHISNSAKTTHVYSLFLNSYYDLESDSSWRPFFGAGIGVAWPSSGSTKVANFMQMTDLSTQLSNTVPTVETTPSVSGTAFAWQLKAGLAYDFDCHLSVITQYRLFGTTNFKTSGGRITLGANTPSATHFPIQSGSMRGLINNGIDFNIQYTF